MTTIYRLENPLGLLFLLIPIFVIIIFFLNKKIFKRGASISGVSDITSKKPSFKIIGYNFSIILLFIGMSLMAFSLSKPQSGIKKERYITQGIDIMIVLDVSGSMLIKDSLISPTRIDIAKSIISGFIDKRKGDRIGLVIFESTSMVKCPATLNHSLLKGIISKIYIDPNKRSSTAIGLGLASGINRLLKLTDNKSNSSKIIILVTDGANNTGEISPEAATNMAVSENIKVYTVGIGQDEEIDMELLEDIAKKTNAKFFYAKTSVELGNAFNEIDRLEKVEMESIEFARFNNIGYNVAMLGIILLAIGIFLNSLFFRRL